MKRIFLLTALLAPFFMASCSSDNAPADETTRTGTLRIGKATLDLEVDLMSRADVTIDDCFVILHTKGEKDFVVNVPYPQEGIIEDIPAGEYTLFITTERSGAYEVLTFDTAMYEYSTDITIEAGKQTVLEEDIKVPMITAGVVFDYTGVEGTELENVVPIVTFNHWGGDLSLIYSGENRTKTGYFHDFVPMSLTITFTLDDEPLTVNGGEVSKQITANPKELWTIKLSVTSTEDDPYGELGAAGPELIVEPEGLGW